jgi:hypothetical protein
MGAIIASAIFAFIADMTGAVAALMALALFLSGILIVTGIGGQGIQKHVRGAFLAIMLCGLLCFGANRLSSQIAQNFQAQTSASTPAALAQPAIIL